MILYVVNQDFLYVMTFMALSGSNISGNKVNHPFNDLKKTILIYSSIFYLLSNISTVTHGRLFKP